MGSSEVHRRGFLKYVGLGAIAGLAAGYGLRDAIHTMPTTTTQTLTETTTQPLSCSASLRSVAEARGLLIGSGGFPEGFTGFQRSSDLDIYTSTLAREFDYLTPENDMKWPNIHPADWWYFQQADKIVSFASDHQMKVKGHCLVWPKDEYGLPSGEMNRMRNMTTSEFRQLVHEHITTLVGHYKGKIHSWDVVNEAVDDDQEGLRRSLFLEKLGEGYVGEAFQVAHEADPDALLFYNDYNAEAAAGWRKGKSDRVYALVKKLLADGVPIHGVGLQMHIWTASDYPRPEEVAANIRRLVALGLKVNISEMDIQIRDLPGELPKRLEVQRQIYHDIIAACIKEQGFIAVTFWDFTDKHSWIDYFFGPDDPLLFDENYKPKPAYWGVMDALLGE